MTDQIRRNAQLAGHSPNPRIGIPVDEFDCSRQLAHVFLFEHDRRMAKQFGDTNYVRWMDDHSIGARSLSDARRVVNRLTRSLSEQRLTLNASKTRFLDPGEVVEFFQLDANKALNDWQEVYGKNLPEKLTEARKELRQIWRTISDGATEGKGYWDKVLKRMYGYAAKARCSVLDKRMYDDLVRCPDLDQRIFLCLARRNKGTKLLALFEEYRAAGECLFEATEASFFEACLLLDASQDTETEIKRLAMEFVKGKADGQSPRPFGKASVLLCLYWFNAGSRTLANLFASDDTSELPAPVARSWLAVVAARDAQKVPDVQAKLVGHASDDVAKLSRFLSELFSGNLGPVGNYANQKPRWPFKGWFYDTRAWLQLELLASAGSRKQLSNVRSDYRKFSRLARTRQEKRVLERVGIRLGISVR